MIMTKELIKNNVGSLVARFHDEGTDFICCSNYVEKDGVGTWNSAEYFETLDEAMDCFYSRIKRNRLEYITKEVIAGFVQENKEQALDFLEDIGLTNREAMWFGVDNY